MKGYQYLPLFLMFACGLGFLGCDSITKSDNPAVPVPRSDAWWVIRHTDKKNTVINNQKIVFIGDSITECWDGTMDGRRHLYSFEEWESIDAVSHSLKARYDDKVTILGFGGDRTQNVIWRLLNGEFPDGINPEYVVLMIGTNNSGDLPESTAAGIGRILDIIHEATPATNIILLSIFPRGANETDFARIINNQVNDIIRTFDGNNNVHYYDFGHYYIHSNGTIKRELYAPDLLHLSPAGYNLWKEKLIEIIG